MSWLKKIFRCFRCSLNKKSSTSALSKKSATSYVKPHFVLNDDKIAAVIYEHFRDFIKWPTKHYNAMLEVLNQQNVMRAKFEFDDMLSLAIDYFKRNRSRLFEWWCMNNENCLIEDDLFKVLYDVYGFNYAFEKRCKEMFDIDVCCDEYNNHSCSMLDEHGNLNVHLKWIITKYGCIFSA